MEHLHLTVVVVVLLTGSLTVSYRLVHIITCVYDGLHILLLQVLLRQLSRLVVRLNLTTSKERLRERSNRLKQQLARIDNDAIVVSPTSRSRQRDAGEEGSTSILCVVESLLHVVVGQTDVRTLLQHQSRHTHPQIAVLKHTTIFCRSVVLGFRTPISSLDVLRSDAQDTADSILRSTDATLDVHNLRLHTQPRRLLLVDSRRVCLSVLIQRPLCLQRRLPKTVSLGEDFQLAVEQHESVILLS